jgi:hypothetical protein
VDYFWLLTDAPSHSRERVIPSGTIENWAEFTGLSPAEFVRLQSVPVKENHVALPEPATSHSSKTQPRAAP